MSIYDENRFSMPDVNISMKQLKLPLMALAGLIILMVLLFAVGEMLKPKPLVVSLTPNPLDLLAHAESSSRLDVVVFNAESGTVNNIVVRVEEIGGDNMIISPGHRVIDSMAAGTDQKLDPFVIRPDPTRAINSGSYKLRVILLVNGVEKAEENLLFAIKAV